MAPAELEAHLLLHPAVADCAVIPLPDYYAGDLPKAFIVKASGYPSHGASDEVLAKDIISHVKRHKARYKWLAGGVEFIDLVPKTPSGKIQRRLLRAKEAERRQAQAVSLSALGADGRGSKIYCMVAYPFACLSGYLKRFFGVNRTSWSWMRQLTLPIWLLGLAPVGIVRAKATVAAK